MYLPVASGSIVGILKQMHDEMSGDEASATKEEEESIKAYEGLMAAKTKEVNALKMLQDASRWAQDAPKMAPRCPKRIPQDVQR